MTLDHQHTRIELLDADEEARYIVRDGLEILAIMRGLVASRAGVTLLARSAPSIGRIGPTPAGSATT